MYAFAVIPARGGSKGLPGKNLMKLGRLSLIGHAVASAEESNLLSRAIVSTDDPAIAAEAARHGAEAPFLRPAALATDEAGMIPVLQHAVRWLEESERIRPDLVVLLQPTSPFRTGVDIDGVIRKVEETGAVETISSTMYSKGSDRNTGPWGEAIANWQARWTLPGSTTLVFTPKLHFT